MTCKNTLSDKYIKVFALYQKVEKVKKRGQETRKVALSGLCIIQEPKKCFLFPPPPSGFSGPYHPNPPQNQNPPRKELCWNTDEEEVAGISVLMRTKT